MPASRSLILARTSRCAIVGTGRKNACAILLAAEPAAWGPIQHAGDLHDRATYRYFWELVQRARLSNQALPGEVAHWFQ